MGSASGEKRWEGVSEERLLGGVGNRLGGIGNMGTHVYRAVSGQCHPSVHPLQ